MSNPGQATDSCLCGSVHFTATCAGSGEAALLWQSTVAVILKAVTISRYLTRPSGQLAVFAKTAVATYFIDSNTNSNS